MVKLEPPSDFRQLFESIITLIAATFDVKDDAEASSEMIAFEAWFACSVLITLTNGDRTKAKKLACDLLDYPVERYNFERQQ